MLLLGSGKCWVLFLLFLVCGRDREMYVQVHACAGLRTSGIIPHASSRMACSLVSLLAGSELQGSTWLCLQKTGVTNGHHHSQIVLHGFWGLNSGKMSTFPARLLPSFLSVHPYMCVHRGVYTLESSSAEPGRVWTL